MMVVVAHVSRAFSGLTFADFALPDRCDLAELWTNQRKLPKFSAVTV